MNIKIDKYDNEGRGIGYYNNKIVFIPNTIIGETVKATKIEEKEKYIIAKLDQVITPSNIRLQSKCPYYGKCGGCTFMHISLDEELRIKQSNLKDLFKRHNLNINDIKIIQSKEKYNYRNKITLKIKNNNFGYYNQNSHDFIKIDYCYLVKDSINNLIKQKDLFNIKEGEITIRSNYNNEILIKIETKEEPAINIEQLIQTNKIVGIILNNKTTYGENYYIEKINNYLFKVNINSFFQVNNNILEEILNILNKKTYNTIVDLYCGVGVLGTFINKQKCYGIEIIPEAIRNAITNAKMNKQDNLYMLGDSSNISKIKDNIDCIIIDPPRSGLNKETIKNIVKITPQELIYMSCNPITLVRDLQILNKLYNIEETYMLEMFPRTKHIECITLLQKKSI